MKVLILLMISTFIVFNSCKKEIKENTIKFKNEGLEKVDDFTFTLTYDIVIEGTPIILETGYIITTEPLPTIYNQKFIDTLDFTNSKRKFTFKSLMNNDLLYIRPYAISYYDTIYGKILNFKTGSYYKDGFGVTDIDGNLYRTVIIDNIEWMSENLRTKRFCNGDSLSFASDVNVQLNTFSPAFSYVFYDIYYDTIFGKMYNAYSVDDARGLCPCGWRIPTTLDLVSLFNVINTGNNTLGGKLKTKGNLNDGDGLWQYPNARGNNASGLSFKPAGYLHGSNGDSFESTYKYSFIFIIDPNEINISSKYQKLAVYYNNSKIDFYGSGDFRYMSSVRCVRDL